MLSAFDGSATGTVGSFSFSRWKDRGRELSVLPRLGLRALLGGGGGGGIFDGDEPSGCDTRLADLMEGVLDDAGDAPLSLSSPPGGPLDVEDVL